MNSLIRILSIFAIGLLPIASTSGSGSAYAGGHPSSGHHPIIKPNKPIYKPGNLTPKAGKIHTHRLHKKTWVGFSKKRFSQRRHCWVYWSPSDCCWYESDASTDGMEPIDDMTDEDCDD
jgi:hypothetical protein